MKIAPVFNILINKQETFRCAQFDMGDEKDCPYLDVCYEEAICRVFQKTLINPQTKAPMRCSQCLNSEIIT